METWNVYHTIRIITHHHVCTELDEPQFAHLARVLPHAYQQSNISNRHDTLKNNVKPGAILGPFKSSPLPNFHTLVLGLIPKHNGGWQI